MAEPLKLILVISFIHIASSVSAQLVTTPESVPEICPDRPPEPPLLENMDFRESVRKILVQRMYRAASFQTIVDTGECTCAHRFPSWDTAVNYYLANYARLQEQWDIQETTKGYRDSISRNRPAVREICIAQNNWK